MSRIPFSEFRMTGGSFALFASRQIDSHLRLQPVAAPRPRPALVRCPCTSLPLRLGSLTVISKGVVPSPSLPARVNALSGLQNAGCLIAPPPARPGDKPRHRRRTNSCRSGGQDVLCRRGCLGQIGEIPRHSRRLV